MKATFSMRLAKVREDGKTVEKSVEWVEVSGFPSGDVVSRRARPADLSRFKSEYAAFLAARKPKATAEAVHENQRRNNDLLGKVLGKRKG